MPRTITRIDVSRPPGVSRRSTTRSACSRIACARPRSTYSAVAGPMTPVTSMSTTLAGAARNAPVASASAAKSRNRSRIRDDFRFMISSQRRLSRKGPSIACTRTGKVVSDPTWSELSSAARRQRIAPQERPLAERGLGRRLREVERDVERRVELAIAARARVLRRIVDLDVRVRAVVLDGEAHVPEPERELGLRRLRAVDELVPRVDPDHAAPRARAEEWSDLHQ